MAGNRIVKDRWGTKEWFEDMLSPKNAGTVGDKWGNRWRGSQKYRFVQSLEVIKSIITQSGKRLNILDIGCAFGDFTERVWRLNPQSNIYATDISENAIAVATEKLPQVKFKVDTLPNVEFEDGFFDIVISLEVVYYMGRDNRRKSMKSMHRILKNGGHLLLSGTIDGGKRYFDIKELHKLLGEVGFKVTITRYLYLRLYNWFEGPVQWIHEAITSVRDIIEMTDSEYQKWFRTKDNNSSLRFVNRLRKIVRSLPWGSKIANSIMCILGIPFKYAIAGIKPVAICDTFTRLLLGIKGATKIIVLAQKSNEKQATVYTQE
jgi:2-polyprenyl-3-methyl-5-hydroxy-6-metoxy-1,4-benzoquinol methylase